MASTFHFTVKYFIFIRKRHNVQYSLFVFSFHQTHYNGDEDPAFLIDDVNIEQEQGEDSDDDSVTG